MAKGHLRCHLGCVQWWNWPPKPMIMRGKKLIKKGQNQFGQGSPPNLDNAQKKGFFSERASFIRRINCCNSLQCSALMTTIMWCNVMFQVFRAFLVLAKIPMAIEKHQEGDRSHQITGCLKTNEFLAPHLKVIEFSTSILFSVLYILLLINSIKLKWVELQSTQLD